MAMGTMPQRPHNPPARKRKFISSMQLISMTPLGSISTAK